MIFFQNIEILIQELFEIQAKVAPNSLAVVHEGRKLTYRELNSRANRLAHRLRQEGVGPDVLVAISTERSLDMVVGVLGILKAGGAYVPVDPGYPQDRIAYMLSDSAPRVLLTQKHLRQGLPEVAARVLLLDEEETYENQPAGNPSRDETGATSGNLAYVIYTSGSTGLPKGVMIEHASVCNLAQAQRDALAIDGNSRILQFASMSFDACVWEMVMALLNGAQLHLASREALMPGRGLFNLLEEKQISHVTLPPTALGVMSKQIGADKIDGLTYLQTLVVAGEACPPSLAVQ